MKNVKVQIALAVLLVVASPIILTKLLPAKVLLDVLPVGATVFLTICYLPQIYRTYKTKNVESMSISFWVMLNIALTLLLTNAYAIWGLFGTYGYLVTEILNEGLALITLGQVLYYKSKQKQL
jgi:uncharacterized protein with PQ loop repeat